MSNWLRLRATSAFVLFCAVAASLALLLSKKYVLLSAGNLSNTWHRDIIVRFFNRHICSLKNRENCPALLDIYVQIGGVGLGTKKCNLKNFLNHPFYLT